MKRNITQRHKKYMFLDSQFCSTWFWSLPLNVNFEFKCQVEFWCVQTLVVCREMHAANLKKGSVPGGERCDFLSQLPHQRSYPKILVKDVSRRAFLATAVSCNQKATLSLFVARIF